MKIKQTVFLFIILFMTSGCYAEMTGIVVDAETGQPIKGAVVLVQWTETKGLPGMSYHELHKIVEVETSEEGKFKVSETSNPLVGPPTVVIYKSGYVAWRNDFIFPGWKKQTNSSYQTGSVIKLEKFKETYSHEEHIDFIEYGIIGFYELPITDLPKMRMGIEFEKRLTRQKQDK